MENSNPDNSNPDNTIVVENELQYEDVNEGQWVIVVYEGERFVGKITENGNKMFAVRYLEKPLGIGTPQDLEKETDVVFYDRVYQANVQPSLVKVKRGWKWAY